MTRIALALPLAAALTLAGDAPAAAADIPDYGPHDQWNGLSKLIGLAEGMGFSVSTVSSLEWGELSASEVLVIAYPLQRVDPARLGAFLSAGGNVIIADDFGEGKDAMQSLGLLRTETDAPRARRYEANQPWAPVATVRQDHPMRANVDASHPSQMK